MRSIGVVTTSRADYGIYRPVLKKIEADADLNLELYVSGMHLSQEHGMTIEEIEKDGFLIKERISILGEDSPKGIAISMGQGIIEFGKAFEKSTPDILLVLGDRFEMLSSVIAALPFNIPIAHIHGGESTEGLIDEAIRHSISKMSHLHFPSTPEYAQRIIQMGEEPEKVTLSGAPSLDNLNDIIFLSATEISKKFSLTVPDKFLLVTYHPVTLEYEQNASNFKNLLEVLEENALPVIFTFPNTDTYGTIIIKQIEEFLKQNKEAQAVKSLGTQGYFSLMKLAMGMLGNSSSGIIEAASFSLPVLNIGNRQKGRHCSFNVVYAENSKQSISDALQKVISPEFKNSLRGMKNPYGNGNASQIIVKQLKNCELKNLIFKKFHDIRFA
jgi:UDP-N-acetylglucosamine 2-epimerase (non-hydrolysing)/GDP/UDP-N,N'-diacetylbacillosamine 2-epimerase (hydrolysing)